MKKFVKQMNQSFKTFAMVSGLAFSLGVNADDTEIFYSVNVANNLLFVLDASGSMKKQIEFTEVIDSSGSTTTNSGGVSGEFDKKVTDDNDDAHQLWTTVATGGSQWDGSNDLDLEEGIVVGTRFTINSSDKIPQGATILSAYIQFTSTHNDSPSTSIDIAVENTGYAYDYDWDRPKILSRPYVGSVTWTPVAWSDGDDGAAQRTPDLKDLVQQVVNRSDWGGSSTNRIAFKFETSEGERDAYSRDGSGSKRPELFIEYTTNGTKIKNSYGYIDDDEDDAEQEWTYSNDQDHGENTLVFNDSQVIATRFRLKDNAPDALIPQGALIINAYITFTSAGSYAANTNIEISVEDTGNAKNYSSTNPKIRARAYHGLELWQPVPWANAGDSDTAQETVDLTELVQHVVNRSDWDNALAFMFNTTSGERIAYARDQGSNEAPVLHVEYQDLNGTTGTTVTTTGTTTTITRVESRLKLMQEALREVLETAPNLQVGLMKYSGIEKDLDRGTGSDDRRTHYTAGVTFPVSPIYAKANDIIGAFNKDDHLPNPDVNITVRDYLADVADIWEATGGTPIVDALYEAALYFRGEKMHYGLNKNNNEVQHIVSPGSHPATYEGGAMISKPVGGVGRAAIRSDLNDPSYISPITSDCQSNYIVLMSDGKPTYYYNDQSGSDNLGPFARAMMGTAASGVSSAITSCLAGNADNSGTNLTAGTCGREITQFLANNDQSPTVEGEQPVKTFTIGFGHDLDDGARDYLKSLVTVDGVGYYNAEDKETLKQAFKEILQTVAEPSGTLASPGYSVNVKSGLEHEKDIYIPVFDRKNSSRWAGNLKKFRIVDDNGKRSIKSRTGTNAVDELGGFEDAAIDYWSTSPDDEPDGKEVVKGGVASLLSDPEGRLLVSNLNCGASGTCDLTQTGNLLTRDNISSTGLITNDLLGLAGLGLTEVEALDKRKKFINFIRGWEDGLYDDSVSPAQGTPRFHMGDMLHSEPLVITYKKEGHPDGKKQYIFAGTNEGFLHAFDTAHEGPNPGKEMFAFMPRELLQNIKPQFYEEGAVRDHKYGVDGVLTYWHDDINNNGEVDEGSESVYLYAGLRRGGETFYALDVTRIDQPKLVWMKTRSTNPADPLFTLGQSWSAPYLAKVGLSDGTSKEVVIVSGGYDPVEDRDKLNDPKELDDPTKDVVTTKGHDIFIFDARNGDLIWSLRSSLGNTQVADSIPGGMRILDVNRNGLIDRMYFADTGGKVWRLDLSEKLSTSSDTESKLTLFANLAGTGVNNRKFYNEPDVAMLKPNGKTLFAISIGSGYRAHPKDKTIHDNFYVLLDESPFYPLKDSGPNVYQAISQSELAPIEINGSEGALTIDNSSFEGKDITQLNKRGWYMSLPADGEKALGTAVTYDGVVTFTTLVPEVLLQGVNIDPCAAPATQGRFYAINLLTGKAGADLDFSSTEENPNDITDNDAFVTVAKGEIPGKPQVIFNAITTEDQLDAGGNVVGTSCSHPVDIRIGKKRSQTTGYDACRLESVYWSDPETD